MPRCIIFSEDTMSDIRELTCHGVNYSGSQLISARASWEVIGMAIAKANEGFDVVVLASERAKGVASNLLTATGLKNITVVSRDSIEIGTAISERTSNMQKLHNARGFHRTAVTRVGNRLCVNIYTPRKIYTRRIRSNPTIAFEKLAAKVLAESQ